MIGTHVRHQVEAEAGVFDLTMLENREGHLEEVLQTCDIPFKAEGVWVGQWGEAPAEKGQALLDALWESAPQLPEDPRIIRSLAYLEAETTAYDTMLEGLSQQENLSPSRIRHLFKDATGISLQQYLGWVRLKRTIARNLQHSESLLTSALECGFYDQAHFGRTFKKFMGISPTDLDHLKAVIDSRDLFPGSELDWMVKDYFAESEPKEVWITWEEAGIPVAVAYCAPEKMTEGTYNLYLIAVYTDQKGKGIGRAMMKHLEQWVRDQQGRILIVETSDLPEFEATRHFYLKQGYVKEATIREFFAEGEGKVVFWKKL